MNPEPLLLVPGLMCDHAVWAPLLPALAGQRPCAVVDHGDADSLPEMARRLLRQAPPRFALAGHSMGARVVLEALRQAPDRITRVALLDTGYLARAAGAAGEEEAGKRQALLAIARRDGVRAMAREWVQGMVHPARLKDIPLIESILAMFDRKSADDFERQIRALLNRPDATEVLRGLQVPTLILCGRQDGWAPVPQHEAMHALAPGSVLSVVDDAGHMAPMERPEAVMAPLTEWLAVPEPATTH
ncbi:alpha/beta fold hydrolase [Hydrogenophaga sp. XSHU_21]